MWWAASVVKRLFVCGKRPQAHVRAGSLLWEMDAAGRITLPKLHLDLAGLTNRDVVIVGARNRLEVRDRATWRAGAADRFSRLPTLVARTEAKRAGKPGA